VVGNSMQQAGMFDQDLVLVEPVPESEVHNGDIVAARLGGEATVKRYFRRGDEVVLEPANADYAPILVREYDDFALLGRVAGLFRRIVPQHAQAGVS
jgi:repressor LexA